jgi:hypothetical protein
MAVISSLVTLLLPLLLVVCVIGFFYWAIHKIAKAYGIESPLLALVDVLLAGIGLYVLLRQYGLIP